MAEKQKLQLHQAASEAEEHQPQQEEAVGHVGSEPTSADASGKDGCKVEHYEIQFNNKTIACERRPRTENHAEQTSLIFTHDAGGGLAALATRDFANGFSSIASIVSFQVITTFLTSHSPIVK